MTPRRSTEADEGPAKNAIKICEAPRASSFVIEQGQQSNRTAHLRGCEALGQSRGNSLLDGGVIDHLNGVDLMTRAEAVEEVHEGHGGAESSQVSHQRQIVCLLYAVATQHGPAALQPEGI
ncbi:hypothetical protein Vafri_21781 [Volvox africanus]|uniref:Uncharacterized protein n=1 Tax=Volvox africanus TaxID=51714 RepID=A0A8J4FBW6_9CHLO|nr:hypothetical protein Vafri_21781 [Volvox africanus]